MEEAKTKMAGIALGHNALPLHRFFLLGVWVNADPATLFTGAGVFGFLKSFDAILAMLFEVFSFLAIWIHPLLARLKLRSTSKAVVPTLILQTGEASLAFSSPAGFNL